MNAEANKRKIKGRRLLVEMFAHLGYQAA